MENFLIIELVPCRVGKREVLADCQDAEPPGLPTRRMEARVDTRHPFNFPRSFRAKALYATLIRVMAWSRIHMVSGLSSDFIVEI